MTLLGLLLAALIGPAPVTVPSTPEPVRILHTWDARRAAAWATADPEALRRLYTRGSGPGRADVAMLRAWRDRGLHVEGLRMQVLTVAVRSQDRDRLVLVVSDRIASGIAVGEGVRRPLPRDEVSTHRLVLVRVAGRWRVRSVLEQY